MKKLKDVRIPSNWRIGQTIFNFLEWLKDKKGINGSQNIRLADPFHLSDENIEKYYEEFLRESGTYEISKNKKTI